MPLTGRSKEQRGGDHRVKREPVVRGLAFRSYFSGTPSVCNSNLTSFQRILAEDRSLASGETMSKTARVSAEQVFMHIPATGELPKSIWEGASKVSGQ